MKSILFRSGLIAAAFFLLPAHRIANADGHVAHAPTFKTPKGFSLPSQPVRIMIDKSGYELQVYDAQGWYATYPVVFGNNSLADKCMEGDRCTPEGDFRIINKRVHNKWSRFLGIDYPTAQSIARFKELKRRGKVPANATPGAGVGIHGTWPNDEYMIDRYSNWTNGCIAMKNEDVQELYHYAVVGTPVQIRR
ncbi:L,D-transpeptidase [Flaviaesturariibacter amylovorans]|uniref:L,D-transpeptidase family protein n=1 Tax=Flaviaesturariibacter amylovorans TaxID=1084520 RepID=A0ABP8G4N3_9BACT